MYPPQRYQYISEEVDSLVTLIKKLMDLIQLTSSNETNQEIKDNEMITKFIRLLDSKLTECVNSIKQIIKT